MSIETEFESTITNVQNAYQGLDNLGATIPQNKTIENIKNCLDEIYNNLPKTSYAEGSNITLSNTLKGKLDFEDGIVGYGQASQESTQGYNLLPTQSTQTIGNVTLTKNDDGTFDLVGNNTSSDIIEFLLDINDVSLIDFSQNYYTMVTNQTGFIIQIALYNGITWISTPIGRTATESSLSKTTGSYVAQTYNKIRYLIRVPANTNINLKNVFVMIYKGSYDSSKSFEKYTGGQASPNPSYPQDIEVVRGKNRLDDSNLILFNSNKYISTTNYTTQGKIAVNPSTTYSLIYISGTGTITDNGLYEFDKDNNKTTITTTNTYTTSGYLVKVFKTLSTTKTMSFYAGSSDTYNTISEFLEDKKLMLLEGDYSSQIIPSYLPYNTIEVVERGKNWFNPDVTGLFKAWCNVTENNGEITITATQNGDIYVGNVLGVGSTYVAERGKKIYVKPNTRYTIVSTNNNVNKILFTEFDSNNISLGYAQANTLTTKANTSYITVRYGLENAVNGTTYKTKIMVAEGTDTTYEPYKTPQTYQLSLGEYEFAKIGNYVDTIEYDVDEDKVYKNEAINKKLLSTSDTWALNRSSNNLYQYRTKNDLLEDVITSPDPYSRAVALCNYYTKGDINGMTAQCFNIGGLKYIGITSDISTIADFNTFITNNNIYVYYVRQNVVPKEITTILKDQIKALYYSQSFTGTTIIEIDGQLPLIIKVRANSEGVVPSGSISITSNGTHDVTNYATANVNVTPSTETKTVKSTTTSQTINPTSGKLISQITVQPITLDTVNITPSTSSQTITPTNDGIGQVNVSAVTSSIDNNIVAENIKKNVSILGVTGTYESGGSSKYNAKMVTTTSETAITIQYLISEIPLIDTSNVTNMSAMFNYCKSLTTIPLIDTSNVTNMSNMFNCCHSLTTIPLIDTSNVTNMFNMFYYCQSLTTIPLIDTSKVTSMESMFSFCLNLTTVPVLDFSSVTSIRNMFSQCGSLSDNSINNIMASCLTAISFTGTKTLTYLGLNKTQRNKASTLSNWSAFVEAGWSA